MKIATFNVWNNDKDFEVRLNLLIKELNSIEIDLLALQEVKNHDTFNKIKNETFFDYGYYYDGIAFLSKFQIKMCSTYKDSNNYMLRVVYKDFSFTNLHLDWKHESNRMLCIEEYFKMMELHSLDNEFILGDFNDTPEGKLHFELMLSDFIDLHKEYSHSVNDVPLPTLDIKNNPRWRNINTDEQPSRFDWVLINTVNKYSINDVKLIGVEETKGKTPSDHYGVVVDIDIVKG